MKAHPWRVMGVVVAALVLAGAGALVMPGRLGIARASTTHAATPPTTVPAPVLTFAGQHDYQVPWNAPLRVDVADGTLIDATAAVDDGTPVTGALAPGATSWQSSGTLVPLAHYRVTAVVAD